MSRVGVVMAVRDGARFLAQALRSIDDQTAPPAEVVLVDGDSSDRTVEIARSAGVRVVRQRGSALADAYNTGIAETSSELIGFLSHDDLWLPDKLERQVAALDERSELGYVYGLAEAFVEPGADADSVRAELLAGPVPFRGMEALLVQRQTFDRVGALRAEASPSCDVDWLLRAEDLGVLSRCLPEVVVRKRIHSANTTLQQTTGIHQGILAGVRASIERKRRARREP